MFHCSNSSRYSDRHSLERKAIRKTYSRCRLNQPPIHPGPAWQETRNKDTVFCSLGQFKVICHHPHLTHRTTDSSFSALLSVSSDSTTQQQSDLFEFGRFLFFQVRFRTVKLFSFLAFFIAEYSAKLRKNMWIHFCRKSVAEIPHDHGIPVCRSECTSWYSLGKLFGVTFAQFRYRSKIHSASSH